MKNSRQMIVGPSRDQWPNGAAMPPGDCGQCGGQCFPECGKHPKGCIYGGFTRQTEYWTYSPDCELYHGEAK